jgi:ribonucleoside-diphosphate reductase alpha chain
MQSVREFGEPGFVFVESTEHTYNPCVEIGKYPVWIDSDEVKHSGWQGCNLAEINGAKARTKEEFLKACRGAAILGTLQAGYTNFKFINEISKKIFEREALLGVSITGWMNNPDVLLNESILQEGATLVKAINKKVAKIIGINPAARTTCVKPAGNASVLLKTASGVHGEQAPQYIRNVQMNKDSEVAQLIKDINPYMVEESVWSTNKTDYIISFPVIAPSNSVWKTDLYGVNLLEKVKLIQQNWVEYGTDVELCVDPTVRHNVSNTIDVLPTQWDEVEDYLFDNRRFFAGVSLLASTGDKDFAQAPFTAIETEEEIVRKYGRGAMFASGLIVDGVKIFDNLWSAIAIANHGDYEGSQEKADIRADWIRRFAKYSETYFNSDRKRAEYCLKAVYLLHKWAKIQESYKDIDFATQLESKKFIDVNTTGAAACAGPIGCAI